MLDNETKTRIDTARDILVGKVPVPQSQVEQITIALIYKFMDDMDREVKELGGKPSFFKGEFSKYNWSSIFSPSVSGHELVKLYGEALEKMNHNPNIPQLFRDIFKNAYLPYRDPETLKSFLKVINEFHYSHSEKLGDAFEYLLSILGSQGDAGQFRTPRHIIDFIVEVVSPSKTDKILDPACGTAGFLISAYKHIMKNNMKKVPGDTLKPEEKNTLIKNFCGYDISPDMVRLSLVNLYLHGFSEPKIFEYDTLTSDDRWNEYYDVILANPPFMSPKGGIKPHKRFSLQAKRSEVLFVDYICEHLTPNGKAGIIVPEGIIFQSGTAYKQLRKMLVEKYLWAVVSLPAGVFNPYAGVKTSILLLDKNLSKKTDKILFVKIENDGFDLGAQRREINKNDLPEAIKILSEYKNNPSSIVIPAQVKEQSRQYGTRSSLLGDKGKILISEDFNLSIDRYGGNEINTIKNCEIFTLSSLTTTFVDGDWIESKDQSDKGIRLIQTGNIGVTEYLDRPEKSRYISIDTFNRLNCTEVFDGDVLISRLPDPVGRACIVPYFRNKAIASVDCTIIRFDKEKVLPEFFVAYTKTDLYNDEIKQYLTGSSRQRISRGNLANIKIQLPPLSIQQEIVNKIEGYQKIIDGARQIIENYTPHLDFSAGCKSVELGEVFEKVNDNINPQELKGSVKYIGLENIESDTGTLIGDVDTKYSEIRSTKTKFTVRDVLYGKLRPNLNKVFYSTFEGICSTDIFVLRAKNNIALPKLYSIYFRAESFNKQVLLGLKGAQLPRVGFEYFSKIKIPLPTLSEQQENLYRIEQEQKLIDSNKELIKLYEQKIKDRIMKLWEK